MTTHEDDDRQVEVLLTVVALLRVKVFGLRLQLADILAETLDILHVFFELVVVLADLRALRLEPFEQVVADDAELELRLALKNLEH